MVTEREDDFNLKAEAVELSATERDDCGDIVTSSLFLSVVLQPTGTFVTRTMSGL